MIVLPIKGWAIFVRYVRWRVIRGQKFQKVSRNCLYLLNEQKDAENTVLPPHGPSDHKKISIHTIPDFTIVNSITVSQHHFVPSNFFVPLPTSTTTTDHQQQQQQLQQQGRCWHFNTTLIYQQPDDQCSNQLENQSTGTRGSNYCPSIGPCHNLHRTRYGKNHRSWF